LKRLDNEIFATILEARKEGSSLLLNGGFPDNRSDADILLSWVLRTDRNFLLAHPERRLTAEQCSSFGGVLERRLRHEPVAYITGEAPFRNCVLSVDRGCLIPRPETELLVDEALALPGWHTFVDWGTGSGCIALSLLTEKSEVSGAAAIEVSASALSRAWENFRSYGVLDRCLLWHGSSFETLPSSVYPVDLLVSNPPYIPTGRIEDLETDVLREPRSALDGGVDGLDVVRRILKAAPSLVRSGGHVLMEIGDDEQANILAKESTPGLVLVDIKRDFNNICRIVLWGRV